MEEAEEEKRRGREKGGEEVASSVDIVHGSSDDGCGVARGPVLVTQVHRTNVLLQTTINSARNWAIMSKCLPFPKADISL